MVIIKINKKDKLFHIIKKIIKILHVVLYKVYIYFYHQIRRIKKIKLNKNMGLIYKLLIKN